MLRRSFDLELLLRATHLPQIHSSPEEFKEWFNMPLNVMLVDDENVGLATFEYPGVYTTHWFYKVRGRAAINLGKQMCREMFEKYGAKILRALIRVDLKNSRWACRQLGFKSHGVMTFANGEESEVFTLTKKEFIEKETQNG